MTDKLTRDEVNRYIHERIMLKCWHEPDKSDTPSSMACKHCGLDWLDQDVQNPRYTSDASPRSLLNEVVAMVLDLKRSDSLRTAFCSRINCENFTEALKHIIGYESDSDAAWLVSTATAEQIARACVEAGEARDGK